MLNALTFDVEDYFQVSNFEGAVKREDWDRYESRVVENTRRILDILLRHGTKATFFILGWTAERFPEIAREIDSQGHEIASHGYSHRLVYRMSKEEFREDLTRSIKILESLIDKRIMGFRAASCSITRDSLWAFDLLKECGIKYDASIFPIHHDRYGIPDAERFIHRYNGNGLVEFPFSTMRIFGKNAPVGGGGYLRLYPYWFTKLAINRIDRTGHPAMVYIHPWEMDHDQPRIKCNVIAGFRHYVNLKGNERKLENLLKDFKFGRVADVLKSRGLV